MLLFEAKSPQNLKSKNTTGYNAIFRFLISLLFVIRLSLGGPEVSGHAIM